MTDEVCDIFKSISFYFHFQIQYQISQKKNKSNNNNNYNNIVIVHEAKSKTFASRHQPNSYARRLVS